MKKNFSSELSPARTAAYSAVTCALLIAVQYALSAVPGVECVTVVLLCASYCFGPWFGGVTGLAFSLLRCIIFGFAPAAIILYCIYFPMFGIIFGLTGRLGGELDVIKKIAVNVALAALTAAAFFAAGLDVIKISRIYKEMCDALLYTLGSLFFALIAAFDILWIKSRGKNGERALFLFFIVTAAAMCTICFTLLDDVISPLMLGMTFEGALVYFYASFTAMLPQTLCTIVTVGLMFYPLTAIFGRIKR